MRLYICDICGDAMEEKEVSRIILFHSYCGAKEISNSTALKYDICKKCYDKLSNKLNDYKNSYAYIEYEVNLANRESYRKKKGV